MKKEKQKSKKLKIIWNTDYAHKCNRKVNCIIFLIFWNVKQNSINFVKKDLWIFSKSNYGIHTRNKLSAKLLASLPNATNTARNKCLCANHSCSLYLIWSGIFPCTSIELILLREAGGGGGGGGGGGFCVLFCFEGGLFFVFVY